MWKGVALSLCSFFAGTSASWGNPGHEVTIAELNAQILQSPGLPELYFQRAWNYREIGKLGEARADWGKTLELNPGFLPASRELARADASQDGLDAGIARLRLAMASAPAEQAFHLPGCHSVLAELLLKEGRNEEALREAQTGLDCSPDLLLDLCLLKSEAQRRLGLFEDRVRDLSAAMLKLRSFVVKTKWYDAMIDAGRGAEILPEIDQEIANTRYQASWLIRRARIRLHAADPAGATDDSTTAWQEIETRLRPDRPDVSLVCDRGVISALRGNYAAAESDLGLARSRGADFWMTLALEAALNEKRFPPRTSTAVDAPSNKNSGDGNNK